MTSAAGYHERNKASPANRPGLSHLQHSPRAPPSPHTPQRNISSAFASPSGSYRLEEESLVFEFGARYFRAGFAGEGTPRCTLGFGPEESRRVGDYRRWLPGYEDRPRKKQQVHRWGKDYELWRMDLRDVDLGLVADKVERAVREAYSKYLLTDLKPRRVILVLPPVMPHPLLSTLLSTLFNNSQSSSISLVPTPVPITIAAGLRSGLVVDVGWSETLVTAVYEYREVHHCRSTRAMKLVTLEMGRLLHRHHKGPQGLDQSKDTASPDEDGLDMTFDQAEEATTRMAWCRSNEKDEGVAPQSRNLVQHISALTIAEHEDETNEAIPEPLISIPVSSSPYRTLDIPFSKFADPVEAALFAQGQADQDLDDQEQPLHKLIFRALLSLPPDVRGICMARIIITGGGSNIPGLKTRILVDLEALVQSRGWNPVIGKAADERLRRLKEKNSNRQTTPKPPPPQKTTESTDDPPESTSTGNQAAFEAQVPDPIEEKLRRKAGETSKPSLAGVFRIVESLGAWAGASLVAGLRIKGVVEVEKDAFLQHGLAGAKRDAEVSVVAQRQSSGLGIPRAGVGDGGTWTLGAFA
ncbi:Actin-related protein 10 (Arp10) [Lasallia pustulata]|uniref:Actin-related protein 10 (Arp10) n=1 Tax=Lasallia pustulata TaxID=136370 RepID=A0A1W5CTV2_9LECA|nr:Actin-related protein 10 (Arp10) [Lasallia pustulata]